MLGRKVTRRFCSFPVVFLYCNLASMGSVQQFVRAFKKKKLPLHVLVNNGQFWRIPEGRSEANTESARDVLWESRFPWTFVDVCAHSRPHVISRVCRACVIRISNVNVLGENGGVLCGGGILTACMCKGVLGAKGWVFPQTLSY